MELKNYPLVGAHFTVDSSRPQSTGRRTKVRISKRKRFVCQTEDFDKSPEKKCRNLIIK